jgi:hypothetical protein
MEDTPFSYNSGDVVPPRGPLKSPKLKVSPFMHKYSEDVEEDH